MVRRITVVIALRSLLLLIYLSLGLAVRFRLRIILRIAATFVLVTNVWVKLAIVAGITRIVGNIIVHQRVEQTVSLHPHVDTPKCSVA